MSEPVDLGPAAQRIARLVAGMPGDALGRPTPCAEYSVGDLLEHVYGATHAFRGAAAKAPLPPAPPGDAARLPDDWRTSIPAGALALADAWRDPEAWTGMTGVGGVDLPGEIAGIVALDELVIHGWDFATATGQPADYDGPGLDAVHAAVLQFRANGLDGILGPEMAVPEDAPLLDRILGVTGRDPSWTAPG